MRHGTAVLSALIVALAPAAAFAGGTFTQSSDILGISLETPADQVQSAIRQAVPDAEVTPDHAIIGTGQITRDVLIGYLVNATPAVERPASSTDASSAATESDVAALVRSIPDPTVIGGDHLRIATSPNENDNQIYAIGRLVNFPKGHRPLIDAVVAGVVAKYGVQAFDDTDPADGTRTLTWLSDAVVTKRSDLSCDGGKLLPPVDGMLKATDESAGFSFQFMVRDFARPAGSPLSRFPDCGTILTIRITLAAEQDGYASSMNERLIDYKRGYRDAKAFSDKFWSDESSALQISRQDASQNTPRL